MSPCEVSSLYHEYAPDTAGTMVAHYPFSGSSEESAGRSPAATLSNTTFVPDELGVDTGAISFASGSATLPVTIDSDTRSVRMRVLIPSGELAGPFPKVLFAQESDELSNGLWRVSIGENARRAPKLELYAGGRASQFDIYFDDSTLPPILDRWFELTLVLDGAISRYYIDGQWIGAAGSDNYVSPGQTSPEVIIGAGRRQADQFFDGSVSDVRLFGRALTDCEVSGQAQFVSTYNPRSPCQTEPTVFPNPVEQTLYIEGSALVGAEYNIFDAAGRRVLSGRLGAFIDVSHLTDGSYVIRLGDGCDAQVTKFVKTH